MVPLSPLTQQESLTQYIGPRRRTQSSRYSAHAADSRRTAARPFRKLTLREALSQGCGLATPTFDVGYTMLPVKMLQQLFPPDSLALTICHDDTTIIARTYHLPPDDPTGTRLKAIPKAELAALVAAAAAADVPAVDVALHMYRPDVKPVCPHPDYEALLHVVRPHFPIVVRAFKELLLSSLKMNIAPGHKMRFFQMLLSDDSYHAIGVEDCVWTPLMPSGVRYTHDKYRVAGGDVGTHAAISAGLEEDTERWNSLLWRTVRIDGCPVHPTYIAIKLAYTPMTKFGYHFQCQPLRNTDVVASSTRTSLLDAFATLLGLSNDSITTAPPRDAIAFRIFSPVQNGGIGFADPVYDRIVAFASCFINTLPLLLSDRFLRPIIVDSARWPSSSSDTLKDAHAILMYLADLVQCEVVARGLDKPRTVVGRALVNAVAIGGRIDVVKLAEAAHHHPQRALMSYFHTARTSQNQTDHPWSQIATIGRNGSMCRGACALPNAYAITKNTLLGNDQAVFMILHKLGIELPFIPLDPSCSPKCATHGPGKVMIGHDLFGQMRHGYHQASCSLFNTTTTRHDALLSILERYLRKHCHLVVEQGQHLNQDVDSRKSTDILITFPNSKKRKSLTLDYTCQCPFLPKYRKDAAENFLKTLTGREREKYGRHAKWCKENFNRDFMGLPGSTLGSVGTEKFWDLIDSIWFTAAAKEIAMGGNDRALHQAKQDMLAEMHAVVVRYTADHIIALSGRS